MPTFTFHIQACLFLILLTSSAMAETPPAETAPDHFSPPKQIHSPENRGFQGIPSFAIGSEGRMWATWYAGITPGEDQNNYVVLSTSGDGGQTWKEVMIVDPDGPGPCRYPQIMEIIASGFGPVVRLEPTSPVSPSHARL